MKKRFLAFALALILAVSPTTTMRANATVSGNDAVTENAVQKPAAPMITSSSDGVITVAAAEGINGYRYELYDGSTLVAERETQDTSCDFSAEILEYKKGSYGSFSFDAHVYSYVDNVVSGGDAQRTMSDATTGQVNKNIELENPTVDWQGTTVTISTERTGIDAYSCELSVKYENENGETVENYIDSMEIPVSASGDTIVDLSSRMLIQGIYTLQVYSIVTDETTGNEQRVRIAELQQEYEGVPLRNPEEGLVRPENIRIDETWQVTADAMVRYSDMVEYEVEVYRDDTLIKQQYGGNGSGIFIHKGETRESLGDSGLYKTRIRARYRKSTGEVIYSEWSDWVEKEYTRPEQSLGTPTVQWDADDKGSVNFDLVDGAQFYRIKLLCKDGDGYYHFRVGYEWSPEWTPWSDINNMIKRNVLNQYNEWIVTVQAVSATPEQTADGAVARSEVFDNRIATVDWQGTTATISTKSTDVKSYYYSMSVSYEDENGVLCETPLKGNTIPVNGEGDIVLDLTGWMLKKGTYTLTVGANIKDDEGWNVTVADLRQSYGGAPEGSLEDVMKKPTGIHWGPWDDNEWSIMVESPIVDYAGYISYQIELYCDNELVDVFGQARYVANAITDHPLYLLDKSGVYTARARAVYYNGEIPVYGEWSDFSEGKQYMKPVNSLAAPQVQWNADKTGAISFELVENADGYFIECWEKKDGENIKPFWACFAGDDSYYEEWLEKVNYSIMTFISYHGEGEYMLQAKALSDNPDVVAHGVSEIVVLDTRATTEEVEDALDEVLDDTSMTVEQKLDTIKENLGVKENGSLSGIKNAMQTVAAIQEKIEKLEQQIIEEKNVSTEKDISKAVESLMNKDSISMLGAAFSAKKDSSIALKVDVTVKPEDVEEDNYKSVVSLDISLVNEGTKVEKLIMPVTLKMPVPRGMDGNHVVIFHFHEGWVETISPKYENGELMFTVTDFSTFVFAESEDATEKPSVDPVQPTVPSQPAEPVQPTAPAQSSTNNYTAPTVETTKKETVKKQVAIEYRVVRGDSLSRIARKHGISLSALLALNPQIKNPNRIFGGQIIIVGYTDTEQTEENSEAKYDIVKRGDSLSHIARRNGIPLAQLIRINPKLVKQKYIYAGQRVRIK